MLWNYICCFLAHIRNREWLCVVGHCSTINLYKCLYLLITAPKLIYDYLLKNYISDWSETLWKNKTAILNFSLKLCNCAFYEGSEHTPTHKRFTECRHYHTLTQKETSLSFPLLFYLHCGKMSHILISVISYWNFYQTVFSLLVFEGRVLVAAKVYE